MKITEEQAESMKDIIDSMVQEKKETLSNKVGNCICENFPDNRTFCYHDVKQALKEIMSYTHSCVCYELQDELYDKFKEIFGEDLLK